MSRYTVEWSTYASGPVIVEGFSSWREAARRYDRLKSGALAFVRLLEGDTILMEWQA